MGEHQKQSKHVIHLGLLWCVDHTTSLCDHKQQKCLEIYHRIVCLNSSDQLRKHLITSTLLFSLGPTGHKVFRDMKRRASLFFPKTSKEWSDSIRMHFIYKVIMTKIGFYHPDGTEDVMLCCTLHLQLHLTHAHAEDPIPWPHMTACVLLPWPRAWDVLLCS